MGLSWPMLLYALIAIAAQCPPVIAPWHMSHRWKIFLDNCSSVVCLQLIRYRVHPVNWCPQFLCLWIVQGRVQLFTSQPLTRPNARLDVFMQLRVAHWGEPLTASDMCSHSYLNKCAYSRLITVYPYFRVSKMEDVLECMFSFWSKSIQYSGSPESLKMASNSKFPFWNDRRSGNNLNPSMIVPFPPFSSQWPPLTIQESLIRTLSWQSLA